MTAESAELLATWFNDLEVVIPAGDEAYQFVTPDSVRESIASRQHDFVIVVHEDGAEIPIGRCLLGTVNPFDRTAMVGICIGDKRYWNRGLGGEALTLLLEYAFNLLNLDSVVLGVFEYNVRAIACYRRLGFREIGRRRRARRIAGRAYDVILMDLLAEEFTGRMIADLVAAVGNEPAPAAPAIRSEPAPAAPAVGDEPAPAPTTAA